jgi:hypothetical protein
MVGNSLLVDVASPHLEAVVRVARILESSTLEIGVKYGNHKDYRERKRRAS